jgi:hypothetical protein
VRLWLTVIYHLKITVIVERHLTVILAAKITVIQITPPSDNRYQPTQDNGYQMNIGRVRIAGASCPSPRKSESWLDLVSQRWAFRSTRPNDRPRPSPVLSQRRG